MRTPLVLALILVACGPSATPPSVSDAAVADVETPTFTPCATNAQCVGASMPHRAAPACLRGVCVRRCDDAWADCDGVAANGCEVSTADGGFCP